MARWLQPLVAESKEGFMLHVGVCAAPIRLGGVTAEKVFVLYAANRKLLLVTHINVHM